MNKADELNKEIQEEKRRKLKLELEADMED